MNMSELLEELNMKLDVEPWHDLEDWLAGLMDLAFVDKYPDMRRFVWHDSWTNFIYYAMDEGRLKP